ncbi:hypothetical protein PMKS-001632 [Pichia membranifaciens]|uniref:CAP-Gly domain-containing protein n=1 Tax=Pichia membranifaciens TaxID=4926 RepID=A0A1Q2YFK1_9ASCO|nr:hypothetical protein PMKS-001632 [Pichia membranifaciens]
MQSSVLPPLGSPLPFPNSSDVAILKYVGSVSGHDGVFCGLELCGALAARGKNNGSVNGMAYFQVDTPNSGLFVPLRKVIGWLSSGNVNGNGPFSSNILSPPNAQQQQQQYASPTASLSSVGNGNAAAGDNSNELRRHINVLEKRLVQRENDLRELDVQLDELDATLRTNDARLARKEERFNRYRNDKEDEIKLLVGTVEALEKKVGDAEEIYAAKIRQLEQQRSGSPDSKTAVLEEKIKALEKELSVQKDMHASFKVSKTMEINELRKAEMEAYKLNEELKRLREESVDAVETENLKRQNEQLVQELESMRMDMELRDTKIKSLEELLKSTQQENDALRNHGYDIPSSATTMSNKNLLDENGGLKVFVPEEKIDPSAGREDFCSFCDREGHSTDDCPYEKDNIELF